MKSDTPALGDLQDQGLSRLPEYICEHTELVSLNLNGNQLTELPEAIGKLTRLQGLFLTGNQLTGLPETIGKLTQLQSLSIDDNQLTAIPETIGQLTELQYLSLTGNQLTELPASIDQLPNLEYLYLNGNRLTELTDAILQLPLRTLDLRNNNLGIPENILVSPINSPMRIVAEYFALSLRDMKSRDNRSTITRQLEFPPQYRQAGLAILNYFREILEQRYPNIPCTVRIEQEDLQVRMIIETPEGYKSRVEESLETYALVVQGQMAAEELLTDPIHIMELKQQLERTRLQLEHKQEILSLTQIYGHQQHERIVSLERRVNELTQIVGELARGHAATNAQLVTHTVNQSLELTVQFRRFIDRAQGDVAVQTAFETIQTLLHQAINEPNRSQLTESDKAALLRARSQIEAHGSWNDFKEMMLSLTIGTGGGVMGNFATEIIKLVVYGTLGAPLM